jgi:hypothetical protein
MIPDADEARGVGAGDNARPFACQLLFVRRYDSSRGDFAPADLPQNADSAEAEQRERGGLRGVLDSSAAVYRRWR